MSINHEIFIIGNTFRSLDFYNVEGYGKEMTLDDLKGNNPNMRRVKGFGSVQFDTELEGILKRAKEIVGIIPFPENIK